LLKVRHARASGAPIETFAEDTSEGQQMISAAVQLPFKAELPLPGGGHHVCPSSHTTRGHIDVAINLVSYQFAFSRAKFNDKRCTVVQSNVIC
jgi:cytochrome P450